jgi:hypothetical protein
LIDFVFIILFFNEKTLKTFYGDIGDNTIGINPGAGKINRGAINIGGKNLNYLSASNFLQVFRKQNGK